MKPRLGWPWTSPSCSKMVNALRTGVRETPSRLPTATSRIRTPGGSSPLRTISRNKSNTDSKRVLFSILTGITTRRSPSAPVRGPHGAVTRPGCTQ